MKNINTFYSCPYCKEEYAEPGDLARCILSCERKKKAEEEAAKKAKLEAEKKKRYDEVIDAYKRFEELRTKYVDDYGCFVFDSYASVPNIYDFLFRTV